MLVTTFVLASGITGVPAQSASFAASAAVAPQVQHLGDSAGTDFTLTVTNTGSQASIGAVEIQRPSNQWTIVGCGAQPAGWSAQRSDRTCRFRSGSTTADDLLPGRSTTFTVRATTQPGSDDRTGTWMVAVSRSNQFDNKSLLTTAAAPPDALSLTAHSWEVLDVLVVPSTPEAGAPCPTGARSAVSGSTVVLALCGRNRTLATGTPLASLSSLGGTFLTSPGTFASGPVAPGSDSVVLATWTGAAVTTDTGQGKTVVAHVASATNRTSPLTTLTGYEATNRPPDAIDDEVVTDEEAAPAPIDVLSNDTDPDNDVLSVTAIDTTGTVGSASLAGGTVSYGPAGAFENLPQGGAATDTFTYTASDPFGATDSATVAVTVTGVNDPPAANPDVASTDADSPVTFDPRANDTDVDDGAVLAVTAAGPATSGTASFTATSITFDPAGAFDGLGAGETAQVLLPYTVSDGFVAASSSVTVTVTGVNDPPVANADSASIDEDTSVLVDVLVNDTDPDGDPLIVGSITQPAAGAATIEGGSVRFSPVGAFDALAAGSSTDVMFGYRASDGTELSDPATVTVTVTGVNDPPVAAGDSAATDKLTPVPVVVLANDSDLDDGTVLAVTSVTAGAKGTTAVEADGTVTYTPGAAVAGLRPGQSTTDAFDYTVSDGTATDTATVEVTINGANTAPMANDDPGGGPALDVGEDATDVVLDVLANDVDAEGDPLSVFSVDAGLTLGTVTKRSGDVTFTPLESANALGVGDVQNTMFTYTASDGSLTSNSATVTVTVVGANDPPVAQNDSVQTDEGAAITIDVRSNDTDPDTGDQFAVTLVGQPSKGSTAIDADGDVVFDPGSAFDALTKDETEDVEFTYTITDEAGASSVGTVTVTVVGMNQPPLANADSADAVGNTLLTTGANLLANDTDPDGDSGALMAVAATVPTANGGSATIASAGTYTYLPPVGFQGTDTFTYSVQDLEGASANGTVTVTVTGMVWYVDASASPGGDGRSTSPLTNLSSLNAAGGAGDSDTPGDVITLRPGTYTGGLPLEVNQRLVGPKQGLTVGGVVLTPPQPATTSPVVQGGVVLASGVDVEGVDLGATTSGPALRGTNVTGATVGETAPVNVANPGRPILVLDGGTAGANVTLASVQGGGTLPVQLLDAGGTVTLGRSGAPGSGGVISDTTGDAVRVEGGNLTFTIRNVNFATIGTSNAGGTIRDLDAVDVRAAGSHTTVVVVEGAVVSDVIGKTLRVTADAAGTGGIVTARLDGASVTGVSTPAGVGGDRSGGVLLRSRRHTARVDVTNSSFTNVADGDGTISVDVNDTGDARLVATDNTITGASATAVQVYANSSGGDSTTQAEIRGNTIAGSGSDAVTVANFGGTGTSEVLLDLRNNQVPTHSNGGPSLAFSGGVGVYAFEDSTCARVSGNVVADSNGLDAFVFDRSGASTLVVEEVPDGASPFGTYLVTQNPGSGTITAVGSPTLSGGAPCPFFP